MSGIQSTLGVFAFFALAWAISENRWKIRLRPVIGGFVLAVLVTIFITQTSFGKAIFNGFGQAINVVIAATRKAMVEITEIKEPHPDKFVFLTHVLPSVVVFCAIIGLLYFLRIIQAVVWVTGTVTRRVLGIGGAEANVMMAEVLFGPQESQALAAKYLPKMSRSELLTVMVGGLSTIAGGVFAAFVGMLDGKVPDIAGHLTAASVMNALLAVVFSKIVIPETVSPQEGKIDWKVKSADPISALVEGGWSGLLLACRIFVALLVLYAVVFMIDGQAPGFVVFLGKIFQPAAWLMGIPAGQLEPAGQLLAERLFMSEFVAYDHFATTMTNNPEAFDPRTKLVLSYALCGFANLLSLGALISGLYALVPGRRVDIAKLGWKALLLATLSTFTTANLAALIVYGY